MKERDSLLWIRHICENTALYHHRHVLLTSALSTAINLGRLPLTCVALLCPDPRRVGGGCPGIRCMLEKDTFMIGKILQKTSAGSADFEILDCPRRVNQKETAVLSVLSFLSQSQRNTHSRQCKYIRPGAPGLRSREAAAKTAWAGD